MSKSDKPRRIPLAEQLDELQQEYDRRHRAYAEMESRGLMRHHIAQAKQQRLAAAINTLVWLEQNQDMLRSYAEYYTNHARTEREMAVALEAMNEDHAEAQMPTQEAAE